MLRKVGPELLSCYGNLFDGDELEVIASWESETQKSYIYRCPELLIYFSEFIWSDPHQVDLTLGSLSDIPNPERWISILRKSLDQTRIGIGQTQQKPIMTREDVTALVLTQMFA
jgi:hypothetical protein